MGVGGGADKIYGRRDTPAGVVRTERCEFGTSQRGVRVPGR